jgi:hypothetical protein
MRFPLRSLPVGMLPVLLLIAGACTTLHTVPPADLKPRDPLARLWVTRADHSVVIFDSARVSADSLVGMVNGESRRIPLSEAAVIRTREQSDTRTSALVLAVGGAAAVVTVYLLNQNPGPSPGPCVFLCPRDHPNCCQG